VAAAAPQSDAATAARVARIEAAAARLAAAGPEPSAQPAARPKHRSAAAPKAQIARAAAEPQSTDR
ncbi:secretin, partial [Burkholderia cenocepacia]|nr:secretin [Burkholderia cenocepacia]